LCACGLFGDKGKYFAPLDKDIDQIVNTFNQIKAAPLPFMGISKYIKGNQWYLTRKLLARLRVFYYKGYLTNMQSCLQKPEACCLVACSNALCSPLLISVS
jgi:hypothetical protein